MRSGLLGVLDRVGRDTPRHKTLILWLKCVMCGPKSERYDSRESLKAHMEEEHYGR